MTDYITVSDVDTELGTGWAEDGEKARAVLEANAWMTARGVQASDPVESEIIKAGSFLAEYASKGNLYADKEGAIKRKRVRGGPVETETEYQDNVRSRSSVISLVTDMLAPFMSTAGSQFEVSRA